MSTELEKRELLKKLVMKITDRQQAIFNTMFKILNDKILPINETIDRIPEQDLDTAIVLVNNTITAGE